MLTKKGPKIIESHTRLGGDEIIKLVELSTGINMINLMLDYQLNERSITDIPEINISSFVSIKYLTAVPGKVVCIDGHDQIKNIGEVISAEIEHKLGDVIKPLLIPLTVSGVLLYMGTRKNQLKMH
ncbi:hypothetical protein [Abyssisolibacter fermentans]|uniref:hypothetical protein n=1 Tax=Abyssisolibacter fermentans TaxID=1766203 RepID=UPI0008374692|nr:hypothetical protein [Abyssisolibacter fermentans]